MLTFDEALAHSFFSDSAIGLYAHTAKGERSYWARTAFPGCGYDG